MELLNVFMKWPTPDWSNTVFIGCVAAGVIFSLAGLLLWKRPPRRINGLYGYRTAAAMRNQASWDFAQVFAGRRMAKSGLLLVLLGIIAAYFPVGETLGGLLATVLIVALCADLYSQTERRLRQDFND